ncbi:hypothetical protein AVEN_178880-1 [Araneus ventricosus]|uniref:Uncharacterized protein n=1 Tax=Araneus ventricosus TaxID=182803 RepID=A0A4Y2I045_ARAVE|nr:hypothetical protein AVEN_178880-1 [Araneus ventricosus]
MFLLLICRIHKSFYDPSLAHIRLGQKCHKNSFSSPSPFMLRHRGGGGGPGWNGRCSSGIFSPGRDTQGVKAIPLHPAKTQWQRTKSDFFPRASKYQKRQKKPHSPPLP